MPINHKTQTNMILTIAFKQKMPHIFRHGLSTSKAWPLPHWPRWAKRAAAAGPWWPRARAPPEAGGVFDKTSQGTWWTPSVWRILLTFSRNLGRNGKKMTFLKCSEMDSRHGFDLCLMIFSSDLKIYKEGPFPLTTGLWTFAYVAVFEDTSACSGPRDHLGFFVWL